MRDVVDDGPAFLARYARIAAGRDVERDRQVAIFDRRPHRIVDSQVVVGIARVVSAENRLAWQGQEAEADFRDPLDFLERERDVGGHDGRGRRHEVVVLAVDLPREVIPDAALCHPELSVLGREHHQTFVREDDLRIDAVAELILDSFLWVRADAAAQTVLAVLARHITDHARAHARLADALGDEPFLPLFIDLYMGQAVAVFRVETFAPQIARFVGMAVRGDHQVLVGIVRSGSARPALMAGSFDPVAIFLVYFGQGLVHDDLTQTIGSTIGFYDCWFGAVNLAGLMT